MKKHYIGATYELTQENFQHVIRQLDETRDELEALKKVYHMNREYIEEAKIKLRNLDNANEALDLAIHILESIDETNYFSLPEETLSTIRELRGKK